MLSVNKIKDKILKDKKSLAKIAINYKKQKQKKTYGFLP